MIVEFTVIPISFPSKPNGGFVVMGNRQTPYGSLPLDYLNLTKEINSRICKQQYYGNRTLYNSEKNRFEVDGYKMKFNMKNNNKNEIYTIPFIKIHDMTNIFNI